MKLDWFSPYEEEPDQPLFILTNSLYVLADFLKEYSNDVEQDARKCYDITNNQPDTTIIVAINKDLNLIYAKNHTAPEDTVRLKLDPVKLAMVSSEIQIKMSGAFFIMNDTNNGNMDEIEEHIQNSFDISKEELGSLKRDAISMYMNGADFKDIRKVVFKKFMTKQLNSILEDMPKDAPQDRLLEYFKNGLEKKYGKDVVDRLDAKIQEVMKDPEKMKEMDKKWLEYREMLLDE